MNHFAWKVGLAAFVLAACVGPAQAGPYLRYTASLYDPAGGVTFPAQSADYALTTVPANFNQTTGPLQRQVLISRNGGPNFNIAPNLSFYRNNDLSSPVVNNLGQVAGFDLNGALDSSSVFLYTPNTSTDLSSGSLVNVILLQGNIGPPFDSRFTFLSLSALNDLDYILARGVENATNRQVDILLTPTLDSPEPATLGAAALGVTFGVISLRMRSRR